MTALENIRNCFSQQLWNQIPTALGRLTNSEFRRAEQLVRTELLPSLDNEAFWTALVCLIRYRAQAFLSGILAIEHLAADNSLNFDTESAKELTSILNDEQQRKMVRMSLPLMRSENQIKGLFRLFRFDDEASQAALLVRLTSPLAYYMLFTTLRHSHNPHATALQCSQVLIRKGDDLSLNMVSILCTYFDLQEIHTSHSLRLQPYEFSYIDASYEQFCYVLEGKRPRV